MSRSPSNSLDSPGSISAAALFDEVLLTVASSSSDIDRFDFSAAALASLALFAKPQAKTFENEHDARRSVVDFIVSDEGGTRASDSGP